jgi:isocitrate lyase
MELKVEEPKMNHVNIDGPKWKGYSTLVQVETIVRLRSVVQVPNSSSSFFVRTLYKLLNGAFSAKSFYTKVA